MHAKVRSAGVQGKSVLNRNEKNEKKKVFFFNNTPSLGQTRRTEWERVRGGGRDRKSIRSYIILVYIVRYYRGVFVLRRRKLISKNNSPARSLMRILFIHANVRVFSCANFDIPAFLVYHISSAETIPEFSSGNPKINPRTFDENTDRVPLRE